MKAIKVAVMTGILVAAPVGARAQQAEKPHAAPAAQNNRPAPSETKAARLLWVRCKYNGPRKDQLTESEKLTIAEYRKRGVDVVELKSDEFDDWRSGAGKDQSRGTKKMQQVAYAKSLKADAIGGLDVFEVSEEIAADFGKPAGDYFHAWGIALKSCVSNSMPTTDDGGKEARAIPLGLSEADPWAIPTSIAARTCPSNGEADMMAMMSKGRPFLGVTLEGQTVSSVIPGAPAAEAGIATGDLLLSVGGKEIKSLGDLAELMSEKKPGEKVDVETQRGDKRLQKTVVLADRFEAESRNSPDGKPLPKLTGLDINGREVRLEDFKGKVVLLDFWATWCGPCIVEMPLMQLIWENLKDQGLVWVGVSADLDESAWRDFIKDNNIGGIQLRDQSWISSMGVNGYPTVLLVDRDGIVSCRVRGEAIAQAAAAMLQK